jgi:hypothetical protein
VGERVGELSPRPTSKGSILWVRGSTVLFFFFCGPDRCGAVADRNDEIHMFSAS